MLRKAVFALLTLFLMGADYIGPIEIQKRRHLLGTDFEVTVFQAEATRETLASLVEKAFSIAEEAERASSTAYEDSMVSRINRAKPGESFRLDENTFQVLRTALKVARLSEGVYDPTAGPLKAIWAEARAAGEPPAPQTVETALRKVGYQYILLDEASRTLTVQQEGVHLDLEGILQGHTVEKMSRFLKENGVRAGLVSGGGSIAFIGWAQEGKGWRTGIEHPRQIEDYAAVVELPGGKAIASSGDYEDFFLHKNKRYTALLDAKTGFPGRRSVAGVSIVAPDAALAKAVSEAFFVLGAEEGYRLVERLKDDGVEALCIEETGAAPKTRLTLSASEGAQAFIKEVRL